MKNQWNQIVVLSVLFLFAFGVFGFLNGTLFSNEARDNDGNVIVNIDKDYFAGKTIDWIIPFKEGGGADTWARFNAQYLSRHIPGKPTIIISNIPGGGSVKGANYFADKARPDGLMILGTSGTTQMPYLLDDPRVQYDYDDFQPIISYPSGGVVYCSSTLGINSVSEIEKLLDVPMKYASQGPTSLDLVPVFSFDLLGMNVQTVFGFRGRGAGRLAFERGEVMLDYQTSSAYLKNVVPMVERGEAIPLFTFGALDEKGDLIRDPSFPDLPHFGEVYAQLGYELHGPKWDTWFAFMSAGFGGMKLLLTPKETPKEIIDLYEEGIRSMKQDPGYIASKVKALGYYEQSTGGQADKIFELATKVSKSEKEYMKTWLRDKYGLNI